MNDYHDSDHGPDETPIEAFEFEGQEYTAQPIRWVDAPTGDGGEGRLARSWTIRTVTGTKIVDGPGNVVRHPSHELCVAALKAIGETHEL